MSFQNILLQEKLVLVDFFAQWCGPCKVMAPFLVQLKKNLPTQIKILKVDIDQNPATAQAFQIQSVPTLILFKNGTPIWKHAGVISTPDLQKIISQHLS